MHFVCPSVHPSVTFRVRFITYVRIDGLPSNLVQILSSLRQCAVTLTVCIYQRSRSHKTFNCQSTHAHVRSITNVCIDGLPSNMCKCCPYLNDVQWPWPVSIPQRSMSHNTFKDQSTRACVRAITYVCIDGLPSNLIQMLSLLRRCAYIQE